MSHLGFALSRGRLTPAKGMIVGSKLMPQYRKDIEVEDRQDPVIGVAGVDRPHVFLDIAIDGADVGRVVCELFSEIVPKTVENFIVLCKGESGLGERGKPLDYRGCPFHRIVVNSAIHCGDITKGTGQGGDSIFGGEFADEGFTLKHSRAGLLSMANQGRPNTNSSLFMICTAPQPDFDGKHVVFGCVVQGMDVVKRVEALGTASDGQVANEVGKAVDELHSFRPTRTAHIRACGVLARGDLKRGASLALTDEAAPLGNGRTRKQPRTSSVEASDGPSEIQLLHMVKKHKDLLHRDTPKGPATCTRAKAKTVLESLRKRLLTAVSMRQTFVELARDHSDGSASHQGGDLGSVERGDLDPELEDIVFGLEAGALSDVFETREGLHLALRVA